MSQPQCYGQPSQYHQTGDRCGGCPFKQSCEEESYGRLLGLKRAGFDPGLDVLARYQNRGSGALREPLAAPVVILNMPVPGREVPTEKSSVNLSSIDDEALLAVPLSIANKARQMMASNFDTVARSALAEGVNPFPVKGMKHLHIAANALLNNGFTNTSLRADLVHKLGWAESTAYSQCSVAVSLLLLFKIAKKEGNRFLLHPTIKGNTD
jgi:hypothetical protein